MNPFSAYLYDDFGAVVWTSSGNTIDLPDTTATLTTPDVLARTLRIQFDGSYILNLAEVEAFTVDTLPVETPEPASWLLLVFFLVAPIGAKRNGRRSVIGQRSTFRRFLPVRRSRTDLSLG